MCIRDSTTAVHNALVAGGTEDGGLVDSLVCDGIVGGIGAIMGLSLIHISR